MPIISDSAAKSLSYNGVSPGDYIDPEFEKQFSLLADEIGI